MQRRSFLLAPAFVLTLAGCGGDDKEEGAAGFGVIDWPDGAGNGAAPGERATNFRLETPNGSELVLAEQVGEPLVVNFLASWCANCMEEMAALQAVHDKGHRVIGVNLRESADTVTKIKTDSNATFEIGLDTTGKVTRAFKIVSLPGTVVLRADGTVDSVIRGPITEESLLEAVLAAGAS
ncbi:MAG: TlpA family protein disulfide reductase [Thermomicrobiales bacterium]|nr:TlpA family protein disulfide reductase [Thermomicrobiales bacterium]